MKKAFLYLFSISVTCVGFLSSCLGDSDNHQTITGSFGVVRTAESTGEKQVWTTSGSYGVQITWDGLSKYSVGDAVVLSFEYSMNDMTSSGSFPATNVVVSAEYPLSGQKSIKRQSVDNSPEANQSNLFETASISAYSTNDYFSDKWLFRIAAKAVGDQSINAEFYYDADQQVDGDGKALDDNIAVIDMKLVKGAEESGTATSKEKYVVVNFSELRSLLKPADSEISSSTGYTLRIWLRYYKEGQTNQPTYIQNLAALTYFKS